MGIPVGDIIKAGYEGYKAGKTTKSTQKYLKERIPELQKLRYDNTTIQKMVYFELGYSEIAGTMYKAGIGPACERIGGRIGATLGTPEAPGAGTLLGAGLGILGGKFACDTGVDKAMKPMVIEPAVKKLSEEIFSKNKNPEKQIIDLSKLKLQMDNSNKFIQPTNQYWPMYKSSETVRGEIAGGGSSTDGAASVQTHPNGETPSMAEDRLKHNPQATGTHDNPSNESQHEQYEKQRFGQPSAYEGLSEETLKILFENPEVLGALGSGIKGAFSSNVPTSEFTPSNITLQGYAETKDFYDPVTKTVNTDPTQRVTLSDGSTLRYGVPVLDDDTRLTSQPPVASRPYNRESPYSTPNSQSIKDTLYGSVTDYAKGYLYDRGLELAFGKKTAGKIKKAEGYYNTGSSLMKTFAPNTWQAASKVLSSAINSVGYAIGTVAGWVATGVDLAIKAISFIPVIGPAIAYVASAVAYGVGYAIGAVLGFLAFLPW